MTAASVVRGGPDAGAGGPPRRRGSPCRAAQLWNRALTSWLALGSAVCGSALNDMIASIVGFMIASILEALSVIGYRKVVWSSTLTVNGLTSMSLLVNCFVASCVASGMAGENTPPLLPLFLGFGEAGEMYP